MSLPVASSIWRTGTPSRLHSVPEVLRTSKRPTVPLLVNTSVRWNTIWSCSAVQSAKRVAGGGGGADGGRSTGAGSLARTGPVGVEGGLWPSGLAATTVEVYSAPGTSPTTSAG